MFYQQYLYKTCKACQCDANIASKTERLRCQIQDILQVWKCNLQGTVFKCILKHAEKLRYEIQDVLYGNA